VTAVPATPCGEFVRWVMREAKGPRGGRQTFFALRCTSCGHCTDEQRSKTPGSRTSVERDLRRALGARKCARPRALSAAAQWLRLVAGHVERGEAPTVRFAVQHNITEPLPAITARAWKECESGVAMGALAYAARARVGFSFGTHVSMPRYTEDGSLAIVQAYTGRARVELVGADRDVADALRALLPEPPRVAPWTVPEGGGASW
jgi:hypothetical protein